MWRPTTAWNFPNKMKALVLLADAEMLYYNIHMASHDHHSPTHHHHPDHRHPPAPVNSSILRLSALQRLAFAATAIGTLWLAAFWAMR
jgi:hypothetical protein